MAKKTYRLQKRVGSKARILKPYKIKKTGFEDIGLYSRFPWHQTFLDPFVGGWSVALNHPCFDQEVWNTRTIPVIAVNDINSGIIDLAWCLLFIPYNFKMSVKSAIHCQGLWNECRDKELLDRFRSSLRFYYSLEANFHKKEFEEGIRQKYHAHYSYENLGKSVGTIINKNTYGINGKGSGSERSRYINQELNVPVESIEEGIRHSYQSEMSYGGRDGKGIWIRQNMNRLPYQQLRGVPMENIEEGLRQWYLQQLSFKGASSHFTYALNKKGVALHAKRGEKAIDPSVEDALRKFYLSQHSYGSRKAFRFSQNEQRNMNVGSERGEIDPSFEEGMQHYYRNETAYGNIQRPHNIAYRTNKQRGSFYTGKKDYYDEIHSRLRWMQIFNEGGEGGIYNEDFARFLKRFIGKMDCGFIYGDPTYFKTLTGKHYEDCLTLKQHKELADLLHEADKTNTKFLLSYDVDDRARKLYSSFDFETIQVPYSVARSYGDGRSQSDEEFLIRNYNYKQDPYLKKVDFTKKMSLDQFMPGNK